MATVQPTSETEADAVKEVTAPSLQKETSVIDLDDLSGNLDLSGVRAD